MRFIGSKANLLDEISLFHDQNIQDNNKLFCDIFSGTAIVADLFKKKYEVVSNDLLYMSYVIQKATIESNIAPNFNSLGFNNHIEVLNDFNNKSISQIEKDIKETPFITNNYSPVKEGDRQYLTVDNALRIDYIRQTTENWFTNNKISEAEYFYLLASLIHAVPFISNTTGTYGAFLKHWDKRAFKQLLLEPLNIYNNNKENRAFNVNSNELIRCLKGDVIYIDPPYNSRQYESNYHLLETIAKYDEPKIYGITGMRPYSHNRSLYCLKAKAKGAFADLITNSNFKHYIVSYNSDGIMTFDDIKDILMSIGEPKTFNYKELLYRKYVSKISNKKPVYEYLFYIRRK